MCVFVFHLSNLNCACEVKGQMEDGMESLEGLSMT
jgi:hypothetical protein